MLLPPLLRSISQEGCRHNYISVSDNTDSYSELHTEQHSVFIWIVIPHTANIIQHQSETTVAPMENVPGG